MRSRTTQATIPLLVAAIGATAAAPAAAQRTTTRRTTTRRTVTRPASTPTYTAARPAYGSRVVVPGDTIVRVRLNDEISSRTARVGERVTATLAPEDRSGFPDGTSIEGVITEVQRAGKNEPGMVDMDFRRAILPDGKTVALRGSLASLDNENVRRDASGRLEARDRKGGKLQTKWIGYGAGAGAVLATLFGGKFLQGALLGGLGGAVYSYLNKNKTGGSFSEVELTRGTEFGVVLHDQVAFYGNPRLRQTVVDDYTSTTRGQSDRYTTRDDRYTTRDDRYTTREEYRTREDYRTRDERLTERDDQYSSRTERRYDDERVAGSREELRPSSTLVRVNGRTVTFTDARPLTIGGVLYVPLRPVARAAGMRFEHYPEEERFVLETGSGLVRGSTMAQDRLADASSRTDVPLVIDDEVYVSNDFLSRSADMRVNWNRTTRRLDLEANAR